jgi:hypothetical protein
MGREQQQQRLGAPPALLAIIQAARRCGDRHLERMARQELAEQYGIDLVFRKACRQETANDTR